MLPSAFRVPPEPVVTPAKAGARTRRLIFCRGAAERSPSQDCAQAVHATVALVVSRGRTLDACSDALMTCRIAHAGGLPPGTAPVASCSACRESGPCCGQLSWQLFASGNYLFGVLDGTVRSARDRTVVARIARAITC